MTFQRVSPLPLKWKGPTMLSVCLFGKFSVNDDGRAMGKLPGGKPIELFCYSAEARTEARLARTDLLR
jgi:hypothetical protein